MTDAIAQTHAELRKAEKLITYLEGENAVLLEKLRQVERELARVTAQRNASQVALEEEREACAKVADDYATYFINNADGQTKPKAITAQTRAEAAISIATLIRGRSETCTGAPFQHHFTLPDGTCNCMRFGGSAAKGK